jgi:hypothetical protein
MMKHIKHYWWVLRHPREWGYLKAEEEILEAICKAQSDK